MVLKCNMLNVKGAVTFEWRMNNRMCITNMENAAVNLKAGLVIAGFGKITWRRLEVPKENMPPPVVRQNELPVEWTDSNDLVMVGTTLQSLQAAVEARRAVNPNASVCYHDICPDSCNLAPRFWRCRIKTRVVA